MCSFLAPLLDESPPNSSRINLEMPSLTLLPHLILVLLLVIPGASEARSKKRSSRAKSRVELRTVETCPQTDSNQTVLIVKQWHLGPRTITKGFREKYPQEPSQTAIYNFLSTGVEKAQLDLVVGEGCEGEIGEKFEKEFNGWSYNELRAQPKNKKYEKILTQIPLKLKAKWTSKIHAVCGDNDEQIHNSTVSLSNMRGWYGFLTRFTEKPTTPEQKAEYQESASKLLGYSKVKPIEDLVPKIREKLKTELDSFESSLKKRNESFAAALKANTFTNAAVVIGGLHAKDLKEKVEELKLNCRVMEPINYPAKDEELIESFRRLL